MLKTQKHITKYQSRIPRDWFIVCKLDFWQQHVPDNLKHDYRVILEYEENGIKKIRLQARVNTKMPALRGESNWCLFQDCSFGNAFQRYFHRVP